VIKVLIIDKETGLLDSLKSYIRAKGHEAFAAKDTVEAAYFLKSEEPHLVFLDLLFLGTPSGLPLVERMKRTDKKRKIYLMCRFPAMCEILAKRIGADGVIFKPFETVEIGKLIDRICQEPK